MIGHEDEGMQEKAALLAMRLHDVHKKGGMVLDLEDTSALGCDGGDEEGA